MLYYEPKWSDISGSGETALVVIASTTRVGTDGADKMYETALRYCHARGEKFQNAYLYSTNETVAYYKPTDGGWRTKAQVPFGQIECVASTTPQEDVNLTLDVQIPNSDLIGLFLGISMWVASFYITFFIVRKLTS